jgi:hypothetical protein
LEFPLEFPLESLSELGSGLVLGEMTRTNS